MPSCMSNTLSREDFYIVYFKLRKKIANHQSENCYSNGIVYSNIEWNNNMIILLIISLFIFDFNLFCFFYCKHQDNLNNSNRY